MFKKKNLQFLLLFSLLLTGCQQIFGKTPLSDPDEVTFELPEVKIESDSVADPDYILLFDIHRIGHYHIPDINWAQEDTLKMNIDGKSYKLYGFADHGQQIIEADNGGCTLNCAGKISYEVWGGLGNGPNGCRIKVIITQFGGPAQCTSSCLTPDMKIPFDTGIGEVPLDIFEADLADLHKGVDRTEKIGEMVWESTYTLKEVSGTIDKSICDYKK